MALPFSDDMEPTPPQTESTRERGYETDGDDDHYGYVDDPQESDPGDIADEGPGHRG
jgi:hypothetical protein